VIDHVDEMLVIEFRKEICLNLIGSFLTRSWKIDLQGVEFVIFASEIDTNIGAVLLGLASLAQEEVNLVLVCVLLCLH
jgi:hypothetical protein